jgi:uncharacterized protein (UPF0548 family)
MFRFHIFLKIMISFRKPNSADVARFIATQQPLPYSYPESAFGRTRTGELVPSFNNDAQEVVVGQGQRDFEMACLALKQWVHFPRHWTPILPADTPIETGRTVSVNFHLFGLWWTNAARIVYVENEERKFGFAYGTLPGHIERGEELFQVSMDEQDRVLYTIRAFSQPRWWPIWLIYPIARLLQARFRHDSADAVRRFVASEGAIEQKAAFRPDQWLLALFVGLVTCLITFPGTILHHDYGLIPLVFAFVFMAPLCFHVLHQHGLTTAHFHQKILRFLFPAALIVTGSQWFQTGWFAALLAIPWLSMGVISLIEAFKMFKSPRLPFIPRVSTVAGLVFFTVATIWTLADRIGIYPFGFDASIGRLTALHFHYAGLCLPTVTALLALNDPNNRWNQAAVLAISLGVPLTAIGITTTHFGWNPLIETIGASWMAAAGLLAGVGLLLWGTRTLRHGAWIGGVLLFVTMSLAFSYALRPYFPMQFHTLDWMRAVHGTLNGLVAMPLALWALAFARSGREINH